MNKIIFHWKFISFSFVKAFKEGAAVSSLFWLVGKGDSSLWSSSGARWLVETFQGMLTLDFLECERNYGKIRLRFNTDSLFYTLFTFRSRYAKTAWFIFFKSVVTHRKLFWEKAHNGPLLIALVSNCKISHFYVARTDRQFLNKNAWIIL